MADDGTIDLMGGGFTRGMLAEMEQKMLLEVFSAHIESVTGKINDGKEATVYQCRAKPGRGVDWYAAKVYRARRFRGFANNAEYTDTGRLRDRRMAKAIRKGTRTGRQASQRLWVDQEWAAMTALHEAGASVPVPVNHGPDAVLMEFVGTDGEPAPMLTRVRLDPEAARQAYESLKRDVALLLDCGLVHGDLSAYNVLYQAGRPRLIDLPQAVSLDGALDAWALFHRDVENLGDYFRRQGLDVDVTGDALTLWSRHAF
ncbi:MAG: RIO1 family regulatory kinase/ATPase [Pseudomonadales bacterium]